MPCSLPHMSRDRTPSGCNGKENKPKPQTHTKNGKKELRSTSRKNVPYSMLFFHKAVADK